MNQPDPGVRRHWGPQGFDATPAVPVQRTDSMSDRIRHSFLVVLGLYLGLAAMALANAMVAGAIKIPSGALPYLVVLLPILALAVKDFIFWIGTGQWSAPSGMSKSR